MSAYLLSTFGLHNPFIQLDLPDHAVYPLALDSAAGELDLDYSMLLIGSGYVLDQGSYDYVVANAPGFLRPMGRTLQTLAASGLLTLFDAADLVSRNKERIVQKTLELSADYRPWLEIMRAQWDVLSAERAQFFASRGRKDRDYLNTNHFTVLNAAYCDYGCVRANDVNRYYNLFTARKAQYSRTEEDALRLMVHPLVCHIVMHELFRTESAAVVLDWEDGRPYYERLYIGRWDVDDSDSKLVTEARHLFQLDIPELKPDSIDAVIRFVRDERAVRSLRGAIQDAVNSGQGLDAAWMSRYLAAVVAAGLAKERFVKRVRWGGAVAGIFVPGGSLIAEAAAAGATSAAETGLERTRRSPDHYWVYALQESIRRSKTAEEPQVGRP